MQDLGRKLIVAFLIVLISAYSYNAERTKDPELAKEFFNKGVESLKILNYRDALLYFSKAYALDPKSPYGELSFLYLGKSYALYSYAYGSKKGVLAAIGYLNQYPFHYKVPRYLNTQREFIADSYILLQWYETAKNIYANLYGETERVEYMIKYGYASALSGNIEGYNYISSLNTKGVPADYLDLYYMTMGFYNFNLGRYSLAVEYLTRAMNVNTYLREDSHLLFRLGVSYHKLGDWRKALLYLELSLRNDPFKVYEEKGNFYLAIINLETKNFREAYENLKKLTENDRLFYSKLAQILFSSLWYYEGFLEVYGQRLGDYKSKLLDLGWLNVEDVYGELPALGLYYLSLKDKRIEADEREFLSIKKLTLREFVFENDLFTFGRFVKRLRELLQDMKFYIKEDALLLSDIYKTNRDNFLKVFGDQRSLETLARSMIFLGDKEVKKLLPYIKDEGVYSLLYAKLLILEDKKDSAVKVLKKGLDSMKGDDLLEGKLLLAYLSEDLEGMKEVFKSLDFKSPRFASYRPVLLIKLADLLYDRGDMKGALSYYREILKESVPEETKGWAMFRIALISENIKDGRTLKWVVRKAKEMDNIWSRVIRTLWEG